MSRQDKLICLPQLNSLRLLVLEITSCHIGLMQCNGIIVTNPNPNPIYIYMRNPSINNFISVCALLSCNLSTSIYKESLVHVFIFFKI